MKRIALERPPRSSLRLEQIAVREDEAAVVEAQPVDDRRRERRGPDGV
jgi:hypothetical protein